MRGLFFFSFFLFFLLVFFPSIRERGVAGVVDNRSVGKFGFNGWGRRDVEGGVC